MKIWMSNMKLMNNMKKQFYIFYRMIIKHTMLIIIIVLILNIFNNKNTLAYEPLPFGDDSYTNNNVDNNINNDFFDNLTDAQKNKFDSIINKIIILLKNRFIYKEILKEKNYIYFENSEYKTDRDNKKIFYVPDKILYYDTKEADEELKNIIINLTIKDYNETFKYLERDDIYYLLFDKYMDSEKYYYHLENELQYILNINHYEYLDMYIIYTYFNNQDNIDKEKLKQYLLNNLYIEHKFDKDDFIKQINNKKIVYDYDSKSTVNDFDTVKFGYYYKNSISDLQPIEWIVLDKYKGKALLLSKYIIDHKIFDDENNNDRDKYSWDENNIRKWLNGVFYNTAFNEDEKKIIVETELNTKNEYKTFEYINIKTNDNVFLLDIEEVKKYYNYSVLDSGNNKLIASGTKYADYSGGYELSIKNEKGEDDKEGNSPYWLRSYLNSYVQYVDVTGFVAHRPPTMPFIGIRPAIWVDID